MKFYLICFLIFAYQLVGCEKTPINNSSDKVYNIIPDRTPFIAGLLEATNDTVHHYPEVVVGYVSDGKFNSDYSEIQNIEELYNPTLWTQVIRTLQRFILIYKGESEAKVMVTGPLNKVQQKKVEYTHEGNGVYGDVSSDLELVAGDEYLLEVILPDGRFYAKKTKLPTSIEWEIPDTTFIKVFYKPYEDGSPREEGKPAAYLNFKLPENIFLTEIQSNSSEDRGILFLEEDEKFLFHDRSEYLREGSFYGISSISNSIDSLRKGWIRDFNNLNGISINREIDRMRISYFNPDLWENFQNLSNWFGMKGVKIEEMYSRFEEALSTRDSTYLFQVSTIEKVGENGEILPKSENDAIGFFAGYFSVYKKTVLIPVRNFDLDSVLSKN
ncbi:MAG: hypothetical protein ROO71_02715 [Balneola sp.]